ncbi:e3 ubiquitin-protein ligase RNF14 [Nephila pilipes]|uniref:RBR-type E3 ubiquitin transferase n=1 Tax=Nephila pilipes TaxID=299642 RepID=A0A8X6I5Q2_NEPPI|nr:e3 ubiquitin-protein ligase RNF14 [Nephila pilipes]
MDNLESQEMELLALQNIFEERDFIVDEMNPPSGRLNAHVRLPQTFLIRYKLTSTRNGVLDEQDNEIPDEASFQVEHLPPLNLLFRFPETYPQHTCPAFLLSCNWLTLQQLSDICKHLESLWIQNNDAVLYTWSQFLQDESLEFLKISDSLDITELLKFQIQDNIIHRGLLDEEENNFCNSGAVGFSNNSLQNNQSLNELQNIKPTVSGGFGPIDARAFNDLSHGRILIQQLKDYNEFKKEDNFKNSSHICEICYATKEGSEFVTFKACKHFFCRECIKSFFEVQIREGNVNSLYCPDGDCKTQADGSVVKQVVEKELFEKYDKMLLSRSLEDMTDVTFCPRKACLCPVLLDIGGRIGSCPACNFVFCPFCNMAYHGIAPCVFKEEQKLTLFEEYTKGSKATKVELEKRYGKRLLKTLVEETLSEGWKDVHSKNCPHCKASIQKEEGCNKMTCFKCGSYFCWMCGARLKHSDPYEHFRNADSECNLFVFEDRGVGGGGFDYNFEPGEFLNVNHL